MTNLEAKQETIKKAYGEYWEQLTDVAIFIALKNNGWVLEENLHNDKGTLLDCIEFEKDMYNNFRPTSLKGIENNNGWIKIETESDLPNDEDAIYWALKNSKVVCIELKTPINLKELFSDFLKDKITHYQLIEQPKPPIF